MIAGVDNLNARYGGIHNFCIGHRAYHMIGLDRVPEGMRPTFLQLYIHDQDELNDRMAMKVAERLDRDVMQALQQELHLVNPFIRRFKAINPGDLQPHMDIKIRAEEKKRKEKTTPFGVNLMRSQVLYRAAQRLRGFFYIFNFSPPHCSSCCL